MPESTTLLIGSDIAQIRTLASRLDAELQALPVLDATDDPDWPWTERLELWRRELLAGAPHRRVVVAVWSPQPAGGELRDTGTGAWLQRGESLLAAWFAALGCAQRLCADGGAAVALVETPAPLDSAGWGPEVAVAEAVTALVRSLARSEGARGARFNVVTTPYRITTGKTVAPAPPLGTFPGHLDPEVLGAVCMLLGDDATGLTGTVMHADCGRSW